ncbi:MAG: hypothetical protein ACPGGJ_03665, partial [Coraliomargarita sp.]
KVYEKVKGAYSVCAFIAANANDSAGAILNIEENDGLKLSWKAAEGNRYSIEYKTDLLASEWALYDTAYSGSNAVTTVSVSDILSSPSPTGFFRLRIETRTRFIDSDSDSLPDWWEAKWFGNLTQSKKDNPERDLTDHSEEWQLGLDPTKDESGLALTYTYDALGRLIGVSGNSTSISYTLDAEGNLTRTE